jgi:hypothetical protein
MLQLVWLVVAAGGIASSSTWPCCFAAACMTSTHSCSQRGWLCAASGASSGQQVANASGLLSLLSTCAARSLGSCSLQASTTITCSIRQPR